ncbi:MAG TPA: MarR family transcriptional regulator [Pseudonocardia sp.]|jgi:DNA-binding MarR family transcriptional regulator|nr:MarR family transcriptional regulator [Pseudonocardia sp.]
MAPVDQDSRATEELARRRTLDGSFALGLMLRRAHERAVAEFAAVLKTFDIELRHFAVLIELTEQGPLSQRELAARVGTDKVAMVRTLDHLESVGLVLRGAVPGDRRVHAVELTAKGRATFEAAHVAARDVGAGLLAHLEPAERAQFSDLLERFTYPPAPELG